MTDLFKQLLESYKTDKKAEMALCLLYVGAISSDALFNVEDCDRALETIADLEIAVKDANIDDETRKEWVEKVEQARDIIERDREMFEDIENQPGC